MKVVFLAGGIGKRMFPLIEDKFLFKFLGKPLLLHQLETAEKAGLKDFIIIGNPLNIEKIKSILSETKFNVELAIQKEPKGMADALLSAEKLIRDEEIIVVNPNDVFDFNGYEEILKEYKKSSFDSYILGYKVKEYFPGGYLITDEEGNLKGIIEKPGKGNEPSDMVNIVVHLHTKTKDFFNYLKNTKSEKDDIYEISMQKMIKDGFKFKVVPYSGFWKAIKYPWNIFDIVKYFLDKLEKTIISEKAKVSEKAIIKGKVYIDENAKVFENAIINGPCYIGKNAIIGNNCLVRDYSHIGNNSVIGFSTEITRSYIGDNCWFHSSYVGDSIIFDSCSFAAGTITANLRFDEKEIKVNVKGEKLSTGYDKFGVIMGSNCKTGINSCLMPGVKVGPNSIVGPNVVLNEDLEPNKIIFLKQNHKVLENKIELDEDKKKELMERLRKHLDK